MSNDISVREVRHQETLGPSSISEAATGARASELLIPVEPAFDTAVDFPLPSKRLGPAQLYAHDDDAYVSHVLGLLRRARAALEQSSKLDPTSEFNEREQEMMVAKAFIEKALKSREIGPGYTLVVNAVNWALANRGPDILSRNQLSRLIEALNRVLWSPYMHFDTAMLLLDALEEDELNIESPYLGKVTEELDV